MPLAGKIILVIAGVIIIIILVVSGSSGSGAGDTVIPSLTCNQSLTASGETITVADTSRFGPHRNWVTARSDMITSLRKEAESEASDSLNDTFDNIECPEECPNLSRSNNVTYATTSRILGNTGWGWIRYDGSASSQASDAFTCK